MNITMMPSIKAENFLEERRPNLVEHRQKNGMLFGMLFER
jgi:hypothetical protein